MSEQVGFDIVEDVFTVATSEARLQVQLSRSIVDDVLQEDAYQRDAVGENRMVEKHEHAVVRTRRRTVLVVQLPQRSSGCQCRGKQRRDVRLQVFVGLNVARYFPYVLVDGECRIVDPHDAGEVRDDHLREAWKQLSSDV